MSAGVFVKRRIQLADGAVQKIRIQPETETLEFGGAANAGSTDPLEVNPFTVALRKSRRSFGIHPQGINIKLTADGTGKTQEYKAGSTYFIPSLTNSFHGSVEEDAVGTYQGIACQVVSIVSEVRN